MKQKLFTSKIIKTALREAKSMRLASDFKRFKLGAVIFTNKKILVGGSNANKTSPIQSRYNIFRKSRPIDVKSCCHAEMSALVRLKRLYPKLSGEQLSILVYRETAVGEYAMARPCPACEKALRDYGIKHIYYTGNKSVCYEQYY